MEKIRLTSPVEVNELIGSRWNVDGPVVVYDGLGLEGEARPPVLGVACPWCGEDIAVPVVDVLSLDRLAFDERLGEAYGLEVRELGDVRFLAAGLGLTPYGIRGRCRRCSDRFLAVVGYGEKQPGRYMAVYHGVAAIDVVESESDDDAIEPDGVRGVVARALVVALVLAVPLLVGWFHWAAWSEIAGRRELVSDGLDVRGTVVGMRDSHGPRTVDSYWLTVRYSALDTDGRLVEIEREVEVDAATHQVARVGGEVDLVYDDADPYHVDVAYNDLSSQTLFLLVITDLVLVGTGVAVLRSARRETRTAATA